MASQIAVIFKLFTIYGIDGLHHLLCNDAHTTHAPPNKGK
jgi:hypothetical protein